jgi:hypothetical protein
MTCASRVAALPHITSSLAQGDVEASDGGTVGAPDPCRDLHVLDRGHPYYLTGPSAGGRPVA